ncbi:MAG TPA: PAS domain S-box protein [Smithella sp.]|nr:PAS domain S-box protein [Smithella sp.]
MEEALRILILEDVAADADLMEDEMRQAGLKFVIKRVASRSSFNAALEEFKPGIILSDYNLPGFDGKAALKIAAEKCPEVPFIFVSGALGEELAIELLKKGATDYVLKSRLTKLAPSVRRALDEREEHRQRKKAEIALKESENKYRTIFDNTGTAMIIIDDEGTIILANREFEKLTGYVKKDIENEKNWMDFVGLDDQKKIVDLKKECKRRLRDAFHNAEICFKNRDARIIDVIINIAAIPSTTYYAVSYLDISERKKMEMELKSNENELRQKTVNLEEANTALKVLLKHREEDQTAMEQKVITNVKKLVLPYIEKLKVLKLNEGQLNHLEIIENNLNDIISPFLRNLTAEHSDLTPREIQVASLVKEGKTTKEMTELLNISETAVDFHRKNVRMKLGIKNKKANLRSFLLSMPSKI